MILHPMSRAIFIKYMKPHFLISILLPVGLFLAGTGCQATKSSTAPAVLPSASALQTVVSQSAATQPVARTSIRIKAGAGSPFKDSSGNVWSADEGFSGGDTIERPDLSIANTPDPALYQSEHYGMDSFSYPLANGKYLVKLHFCETYDGITGPGQRVFSFNVEGQDFKNFDVWIKAGGALKAYVETVPVEITDGKLLITFTSNVENPQINGIEILPQE
jgi:hypothetical protein